MRRTTDEERALFLAALSGRMPAKRARAKAKSSSPKAKSTDHATLDAPKRPERPIIGGRRRVTAEEEELFLATITGRRLAAEPASKAKHTKHTAPAAPKLQPVKNTVGLDGNTARRLSRGEIAPTAKLDLHGMTESAAHGAMMAFVLAAHRRGDRLILIVTGKGSPSEGVLKQMVPRWLDEAPMAKLIVEKRWAHRRHGGEGALYVYLRKR